MRKLLSIFFLSVMLVSFISCQHVQRSHAGGGARSLVRSTSFTAADHVGNSVQFGLTSGQHPHSDLPTEAQPTERSHLYLSQSVQSRYDHDFGAVVVGTPNPFNRRTDDAVPPGELWSCWCHLLTCCNSKSPSARRAVAVVVPLLLAGIASSTRQYHTVEPTVLAAVAGGSIHMVIGQAKSRCLLTRNLIILLLAGVAGVAFDYALRAYRIPVETNMATAFCGAALIQLLSYLLRADDTMRFDPEAGTWRIDRQLEEIERLLRVVLARSDNEGDGLAQDENIQ